MTTPTSNVQAPTLVNPDAAKTAGRIVRARRAVKNTFTRHAPTIVTGAVAAVITTKMVQRSKDSHQETTEDVSNSAE